MNKFTVLTQALVLLLEATRLAGGAQSAAIDKALIQQEDALADVDAAEAAQLLAIPALNERQLLMGLHKTLVDGSTEPAFNGAAEALAEAEADLSAANADFEVAMSKLNEALIAVLNALAAVVHPPGGAAGAIAWVKNNMTQECHA